MSITSIHPWPLTSKLYLHAPSVDSLSLCVWCVGKQLMIAVGDSGGTLHILEVPWSLSHPSSNEVIVYCIITQTAISCS